MAEEYRIRTIHGLALEWMKDAEWFFCINLTIKAREDCYAAVKKLVPRYGAREAKRHVYRVVAKVAETRQHFAWDDYVVSAKKHRKARAALSQYGRG